PAGMGPGGNDGGGMCTGPTCGSTGGGIPSPHPSGFGGGALGSDGSSGSAPAPMPTPAGVVKPSGLHTDSTAPDPNNPAGPGGHTPSSLIDNLGGNTGSQMKMAGSILHQIGGWVGCQPPLRVTTWGLCAAVEGGDVGGVGRVVLTLFVVAATVAIFGSG
ncbi:MAG: hypothetical protein ACRD0H_32040, partial [Actinomycetes bacterium]